MWVIAMIIIIIIIIITFDNNNFILGKSEFRISAYKGHL